MNDTETQKFIDKMTPEEKKLWADAEIDYDSAENVIEFAGKVRNKAIGDCVDVLLAELEYASPFLAHPLYKLIAKLQQLKEGE